MDTATEIAKVFDQFHTANLRCKQIAAENPNELAVNIPEWCEVDKLRTMNAEWLVEVLSAYTNCPYRMYRA